MLNPMRKIEFVKRKYYDLRWGYSLLSPLLALSNFILLSYNFTSLKASIPFWDFIILFIPGMISILAFVGLVFRKHQFKIDRNLEYERSIELVKTQKIILTLVLDIALKNINFDEDIKNAKDRLIYLNSIIDSKI